MSCVPCGAAKLCRQGEHSPWLAAGSLQSLDPQILRPFPPAEDQDHADSFGDAPKMATTHLAAERSFSS
jgi:hypothetical protein